MENAAISLAENLQGAEGLTLPPLLLLHKPHTPILHAGIPHAITLCYRVDTKHNL
jgi:hypothetical protein